MENFLEHNIGYEEYITGNRFIDACENAGATFCKTDYIPFFGGTKQRVFVTHNSDYHINEQRVSQGPNFDKWFAQNKDIEDDRIKCIPIGLENMKLRNSQAAHHGLFSSEVKGALQKALLLDKINNLCIEKKDFAYLNFSVKTYKEERQHVLDKFSQEKWVNFENNISPEQFYFNIASHKFVFSPRGNGVDCHRTWEALYLRTIPIVKKSTCMNEFSELPIFFVDNWDDLCYIDLVNFYEKVKHNLFNLDKMKLSYWKERIKQLNE